MPWQRHVLDVALELDADGHPAYRRVVLTVPRQSGKTTLQLALFVHRALAWGEPQVMMYAAQTGKDARKKLTEPPNGQIPMLKRSPFGKLFRPQLSTGREAILWNNGSRHSLAANTEKSGHGDTLDLGLIDEAFSQTDARIEQAFSPAMSTRRDAQLWVMSTAGTESSTYLWSKVKAGRDACDKVDSGSAYFEWSADDDDDIDDPATWWGCMPALGTTASPDTIRSELNAMRGEGNEDEFRRAYLNQWRSGAISPDDVLAAWPEAVTDRAPSAPLHLGVAVSHDSRSAALVVIGSGVLEVVDYRKGQGTGWVVARVAEVRERHQIPASSVGVLAGTPAEALDIPDVTVVKQTDQRVASLALVQGIPGRYWHHPVKVNDVDPLDVAVGNAVRTFSGDGWRWSSRASAARGADISPLLAAVAAVHLAGDGVPYDPLANFMPNL